MTTFPYATAVAADGAVTLDEGWSVGGRLHGGYLLAVLGRAAAQQSDQHPHVTAISGTFLTPPAPGPALAEAEVLRRGRGVTQVRARLLQDGVVTVEAHVSLTVLLDADPWWTNSEPVDLPDEDTCFPTPAQAPGGGFDVPLMNVVDQRLDPRHLGFALGEPERRGEIAGWQRLSSGADWDPLSLLVALDAVPPVSYELGLPGWVPTIQMSAYVRRLPAPGPIRVVLRASDVTADRMDETALAWDAKGRLVGQSTQLAAIRVPK